MVPNQDFGPCFATVRHERIHTKRGSCVKMQAQEEEADDLATLEVLDEVREATQHVKDTTSINIIKSLLIGVY